MIDGEGDLMPEEVEELGITKMETPKVRRKCCDPTGTQGKWPSEAAWICAAEHRASHVSYFWVRSLGESSSLS